MYDPVIGRFPSIDPIAESFAHLSTYNYASNNPSTMIDLWGLQGVDHCYIQEVVCSGNTSAFIGSRFHDSYRIYGFFTANGSGNPGMLERGGGYVTSRTSDAEIEYWNDINTREAEKKALQKQQAQEKYSKTQEKLMSPAKSIEANVAANEGVNQMKIAENLFIK